MRNLNVIGEQNGLRPCRSVAGGKPKHGVRRAASGTHDSLMKAAGSGKEGAKKP
jgi:hypothetical protein